MAPEFERRAKAGATRTILLNIFFKVQEERLPLKMRSIAMLFATAQIGRMSVVGVRAVQHTKKSKG